jgi:hypothetical protein
VRHRNRVLTIRSVYVFRWSGYRWSAATGARSKTFRRPGGRRVAAGGGDVRLPESRDDHRPIPLGTFGGFTVRNGQPQRIPMRTAECASSRRRHTTDRFPRQRIGPLRTWAPGQVGWRPGLSGRGGRLLVVAKWTRSLTCPVRWSAARKPCTRSSSCRPSGLVDVRARLRPPSVVGHGSASPCRARCQGRRESAVQHGRHRFSLPCGFPRVRPVAQAGRPPQCSARRTSPVEVVQRGSMTWIAASSADAAPPSMPMSEAYSSSSVSGPKPSSVATSLPAR